MKLRRCGKTTFLDENPIRGVGLDNTSSLRDTLDCRRTTESNVETALVRTGKLVGPNDTPIKV